MVQSPLSLVKYSVVFRETDFSYILIDTEQDEFGHRGVNLLFEWKVKEVASS